MIISVKDVLKFLSITVVAFCATFVCTFMFNFYIDAVAVNGNVPKELLPLYDAQVAMAKLTCAITGGILALIAVIMLIFYVKIYINEHAKQLGILKAMGYSEGKLSLSFLIFGLSVFAGTLLGLCIGYACMPKIYELMTIEGLDGITINFHISVPMFFVVLPSLAFSVLSYAFAYISLKKPVGGLLRGNVESKVRIKSSRADEKAKDKNFIWEMCVNVLKSKKSIVFFVAFACFCFSAMVQMGASMENLTSGTMAYLILAIGLVLAVTSMIMALTQLVITNRKNVSIMKAFGYSVFECMLSVFGGFIPFALLGFAVGTLYQYGLLSLMVNLIFKDVASVPQYSFDVKVFFITLAAFIVTYVGITAVYVYKLNKVSVREVMSEN